jgi:hypothetical protein
MTTKEQESWKFGEQTKKAWLAHSKLRAEAPEYVPIEKLDNTTTIVETSNTVAHVSPLSEDEKKEEDEKEQSNHVEDVATDKSKDEEDKGEMKSKPSCSHT